MTVSKAKQAAFQKLVSDAIAANKAGRPIPVAEQRENFTRTMAALEKSIADNRAATAKLGAEPGTKHVPKARAWDGIPGGSDCFDDADYDGHGTLTLSFIGPKAGVYEYDVDDDEAREARRAARNGELGEWFNEVLK
jgi:hypothetical protein